MMKIVENFYLRSGNEKKTAREKESLKECLTITEFNPIHIKDGLTIRQYQSIQGKNFEHL